MNSPYPNRMPRSRVVLYVCLALLMLLALSRMQILLLISTMFVLGEEFARFYQRDSIFGPRRHGLPASQPRDSSDPKVRTYLVVGGLMLLFGLVQLLPFVVRVLSSATAWHELRSLQTEWWVYLLWIASIPGLNATLMGAVLLALGFNWLRGGPKRDGSRGELGFDWLHGGDGQEIPIPPSHTAPSKPQATFNQPSQPLDQPRPEIATGLGGDQLALHLVGPGLYTIPWLVLVWIAYLGGWPLMVIFTLVLFGLGYVQYVAVDRPLFAALSAPALVYFGWSALRYPAPGAWEHIAYDEKTIAFLMLMGTTLVAIVLLMMIYQRILEGIRITSEQPSLKHAWPGHLTLGVLACILAALAHTTMAHRKEQNDAAKKAAHEEKRIANAAAFAEREVWKKARTNNEANALETEAKARAAAAEIAAAKKEAEGKAEAAAQEKIDAFANAMVMCQVTKDKSLTFSYLPKNAKQGSQTGKNPTIAAHRIPVSDSHQNNAYVIPTFGGELTAHQQYASYTSILRLPAGDKVLLSPEETDLLMLYPDGRLLQLIKFSTGLRRPNKSACINKSGTQWGVV